MKIINLLKNKENTLSFEVFPPKTSDRMESVEQAARAIARLHPDFMSVTYGAGGGTSEYTADISADLQEKENVPIIAHLTCVSSDRESVKQTIALYKSKGIENVMALRGDIPPGGRECHDYNHAIELIEDLRSAGDFCLGGACYPEGHPESENRRSDLIYLKQKVDAGLDFITSQMFFNNDVFFGIKSFD